MDLRPNPRLLGVDLVLLVVAAPLLLWRLDLAPLVHGDESLMLVAAFGGADWMPAIDGDVTFVKAPLTTWLLSLALMLEPDVWAGRLVSALCALGTVVATGHLAGRVFASRAAGLAAGLALLVNPAYLHVHCARFAEPDAPAILFFVITALAYDAAARTRSIRWLLVVGACAGFCALAKTLVIGLLPFAAVGLCDLLQGGRFLGWRRWWMAGGAFALVVLPWHLAAYAQFGQGFLDSYLLDQTLSRMDASEGESRWGVGQVLAALRVALPLVLLGAVAAVTEARARVLLTWTLVVSLALAAVSARLPWYVLPVYPALAGLAGGGLALALRRGGALLVLASAACLAAAALWRVDPAFDPFTHTAVRAADNLALVEWQPVWFVAPALALALAGAWLHRRRPALGGLVLLPALGVAGLEVTAPLRAAVTAPGAVQLAEALGPRLSGRALYLGPILPSLQERAQLTFAHSAAGGSFELAPCGLFELPGDVDDFDHLIVPWTYLSALKLPEEWRAVAAAASPCAQYGAQEDWLVALARDGEALASESPALPGAGEALLLRAAEGDGGALLGLVHLADPSTEKGLEELDLDRGVGPLLRDAALARLGRQRAHLSFLRGGTQRRRALLKDPLLTRLLAEDEVLRAVELMSEEERLKPQHARGVWRSFGAQRVFQALPELPDVALVDLLGCTDGRVLRTGPALKQELRARLERIAAGSGALAERAGALAGHYRPGLWIAWVPTGTEKGD